MPYALVTHIKLISSSALVSHKSSETSLSISVQGDTIPVQTQDIIVVLNGLFILLLVSKELVFLMPCKELEKKGYRLITMSTVSLPRSETNTLSLLGDNAQGQGIEEKTTFAFLK